MLWVRLSEMIAIPHLVGDAMIQFLVGVAAGVALALAFAVWWGGRLRKPTPDIEQIRRAAEIDAQLELEETIDQDLEERRSLQRWQAGMSELPVPGLNGRELLIAYGKKRDIPSFRKVKAESIMFREGYAYLVAWSFRDKEQRHFNLDVLNEVADPVTKESYACLNDWLSAQGMKADWSVVEKSRDNPPDRFRS